MTTSNEKYEQEIFDSYTEDDTVHMYGDDMKTAMAYNAVLTEVKNRNVSFRDLAQIAIDTLSDLELYELTAILNKHQKEKYEQEKDILGQ